MLLTVTCCKVIACSEEPEMHVKGSSDRRIRIKQWYRTPWSRRQQQKTVGSSERHLEGIQLGLQVGAVALHLPLHVLC